MKRIGKIITALVMVSALVAATACTPGEAK